MSVSHSTKSSKLNVLQMSNEEREPIEDALYTLTRQAWERSGVAAMVEHDLVIWLTRAMLHPSTEAFRDVEASATSRVDDALAFGALLGFYAALTMRPGQDSETWLRRACAEALVQKQDVPTDLRKDAARIALERIAA